jgi:hypothetical protein
MTYSRSSKDDLGKYLHFLPAQLSRVDLTFFIAARPGRIHHCMRSIGIAQAALDTMLVRVTDPSRKTFNKYLYEHGTVVADIAKSRAEIESARLLVYSAAIQVYSSLYFFRINHTHESVNRLTNTRPRAH